MRNINPLLRTNSIGYTLIEVLVAIAIGGIVLAGLASILTTNQQSKHLVNEQQLLSESGRTAMSFLRHSIQGAIVSQIIPFDNAATPPIEPTGIANRLAGTDAIRLFTPVALQSAIQIPAGSICPAYGSGGRRLALPDNLLETAPDYTASFTTNRYKILLFDCNAPTNSCTATARRTGPTLPGSIAASPGGGLPAAIPDTGCDNYALDADATLTNSSTGGPGGSCSAVALSTNICFSIGTESLYYIRTSDPGLSSGPAVAPQLVRYTPDGSTEVIADNVLDMQIEYQYSDNPGTWVGSDPAVTSSSLLANASNISLVRVRLQLYSDKKRSATDTSTLTLLDDSGISAAVQTSLAGRITRDTERIFRLRGN